MLILFTERPHIFWRMYKILLSLQLKKNGMFFPHLGSAIIVWTVSLRNVNWFPQITISLKITLATAKWSHWRSKIWWLIMGGWWITRHTLIHLLSHYQKRLCHGFRKKKVRFIVNFAYFFEKGYPASPSTLVSFVETFLPLNLYCLRL